MANLSFDAAEILAPIFKANKWKWAGVGIPDATDIEKKIDSMITFLSNDESSFISTGRIRVIKEPDENGNIEGFTVFLEVGAVRL